MKYESLCMLISKHGVSLAWSGLSIHENSWVISTEELFDHLLATFLVHLVVAMVVSEDIIQAKLVDIVHLYLTFLTIQRRFLIEDMAIVTKTLSWQRTHFPWLFVDGPCFHVLILVDEGSHADGDFDTFVLLHNEYNAPSIAHLNYF